jgi:hypothetical protein
MGVEIASSNISTASSAADATAVGSAGAACRPNIIAV